jgi:hypothetical protein
MSLLPAIMLYLTVGCGEWYLALRRTLACARGEKLILVSIVFIENLLGLWVLSNFVRTNNWLLALSYAAGGSAGALIVAMNGQEKSAETTRPAQSHPRRRAKSRRRSFTPAILERAFRAREYYRRPSRRRDPQCIECPD